jgi:glycosyltransferase involved in cell wall biosynthesis
MRILFLSTWYPYPPDNGSRLRVYYLLKALGARHDVTLLSFAFGTARPDEGRSALAAFCSDIHTVARNPFEQGSEHALRRFLSPMPLVNRELPAMRALVQESLAHPYDAVISSTLGMAEYIRLAPPGWARLLEEHNSLTRQMWERHQAEKRPVQRLRTWLTWRKTRRYEAAALRRFDQVVMVSDVDRAACLSMLPGYQGPVSVVANGVDCQANRPGLAVTEPHTLIYNGALTFHANYDAMQYFLRAIYPLIKRRAPRVKLAITGSLDGVDRTGLALDESVQLCGYIADIRQAVAGAAVCVVPLRIGSGTRFKILEAMALGVPVVATTKGAEGLDVLHRQHILIADSPEDFAACVVDLLTDEPLRRRLAANARQLVEARYDWSSLGAAFCNLVEGVVQGQQSRGAGA